MDDQTSKEKDALDYARAAVERAQNHYRKASEGGSAAFYHSERGDAAIKHAGIYATVAQAEQLKRIADNMDRWLGIQGVEAEFFEAQDRWRNENAQDEIDTQAV